MAGLILDQITKTYEDGFTAVDAISLSVEPGSFVVLVGPSGCGKSTTLRMIAGLEMITKGTLKIGDRVVNGVRPKDRDIAMVFQNYALYPHLSVEENMGFSLRMSGVSKKARIARVHHAAEMLGLNDILHKKPGQLSGGQRQRVALGRAIVREPSVFLFDEPLSNLDPDRRVSTRAEIRRIVRELGTTTVYVTHDHEEAMALGDVVVVMNEGKIEQAGAPDAVYANPATLFVGRFLGSPKMNVIECAIERNEGGVFARPDGLGDFRIEVHADPEIMPKGPRATLGIRPQHVVLSADAPGTTRLGQGRITHVEHLGFAQDLTVELDGHTLLVRDKEITPRRIGDSCPVCFEADEAHWF
ncbi:MAG: ABC transporter ATP-binding protein [Phycisphaerales bacterium JB047]